MFRWGGFLAERETGTGPFSKNTMSSEAKKQAWEVHSYRCGNKYTLLRLEKSESSNGDEG